MHLKQTRQKSGKTNLSIVESWWDPERKRSRQKTVENLGYLEDLLAEHDDPVAWGKARAAAMTEAKRASEQSVAIEIHPAQKIDKRTDNVKNIGCAAALAAYAALGIERPLRNHMRGSGAEYDLNAVCRLLVCERVVEPGSKLAAFRNKGRYFFRADFSEDDVYRALDELAAAKGAIVSAMNRSIAAAGIRDMSAVYYDVTNYYFEIDDEDELRRKGVSKEHRKSPIVQMGLLQDARSIPIAYRVFPGNTADCLTMIPVLSDMKRDHGLGRVVAVADKGLNCSDNIAAAQASGDGFVFSQSVRGTKSDKALKAWVLDGAGYAAKTEDGCKFKSKSKQGYKTVHLKAGDTASGKAEDVRVDVKYVAFWSEKYERRARHDREAAIEKARKLIANPGAYTKATSHGAAQYVKNLRFDKETGEVADGSALELDLEAIAEAEKYDGYYLIVTSETGWPDGRVIDTYRELWRIEESFKVTKSELETRPVYVWTPNHIEAHFLVCYVALVILRLLQLATGLPCSRIREEIAAMSGVNFDANWWAFGHRTDESDLIAEAVGLEGLKLKNLTTGKAMDILADAAKWKIPQGK
ncbi:MAG: IS1634 family transposase [Eggerthellaceae bacterium]|nr:IS1634 family transposase [Eggerthellaceae bacterium]MBQ6391747.1 IS1634 family transposase [Eggerthellaceae bacterium]